VRLRFLDQLPELVAVLRHLRLDVHLLPCGILLLPRDGIVVPEPVGELLFHLFVLVVVENGRRVRDAEEEPSLALELALSHLVVEHVAVVGAHGGDTSACSEHDDVAVRPQVFGQQHLGARGTSDQHVIADVHVADMVRADASVHLGLRKACAGLVRLILADVAVGVLERPLLLLNLNHALHAQRNRLRVLAVAHCGRGDGVETNLGGSLALFVRPRRDDSDRLALDVRHLAAVVEGDVRGLPISVARGIAVLLRDGVLLHMVRNDFPFVRRLGAEDVPRDLLALHHSHALLLHLGGLAGHAQLAPPARHSHGGHDGKAANGPGGGQTSVGCGGRRDGCGAAAPKMRPSGSAGASDRLHEGLRYPAVERGGASDHSQGHLAFHHDCWGRWWMLSAATRPC